VQTDSAHPTDRNGNNGGPYLSRCGCVHEATYTVYICINLVCFLELLGCLHAFICRWNLFTGQPQVTELKEQTHADDDLVPSNPFLNVQLHESSRIPDDRGCVLASPWVDYDELRSVDPVYNRPPNFHELVKTIRFNILLTG
jgi:hypothetical protein